MSLAPANLAGSGDVTVGITTSWVHRPIGFRVPSPDPAGTTVYAVANRFGATFLTGIGVGERLQVNLAAPFAMFQEGASTSDLIGAEATLPRSAAGDLRFGIAWQPLVRPELDPSYPPTSRDGAALALRFDMVAPTGSKDSFATYSTATFAPGASFEYRVGRVTLGADVGARIRRYRQLATAVIGSQLSTSLAGGVDILADGWLSAQLEAFALFTFHQQFEQVTEPGAFDAEQVPSGRPHIPAEWLLSVQTAGLIDGRLRATLGAGSAIPTGSESAVTAPAFRGVASIRYVFDD